MKDESINQFAAMGIEASIPIVQRVINSMQAELDHMRAQLARLKNGGEPPPVGRNYTKHFEAGISVLESASRRGTASWAGLTPEERSIEMKRRMAKSGRLKKTRVITPEGQKAISRAQRERWAVKKQAEEQAAANQKAAKLSRARRREWDSMSKAKRKARLDAMYAGRMAKKRAVA